MTKSTYVLKNGAILIDGVTVAQIEGDPESIERLIRQANFEYFLNSWMQGDRKLGAKDTVIEEAYTALLIGVTIFEHFYDGGELYTLFSSDQDGIRSVIGPDSL